MKKNIYILGLVSLLSFGAFMTSCKDDENTSGTPTLGLADADGYMITSGKLSLQGTAASITMNVLSNVDWNITDDADWLSITPEEGDGNAEVTMAVDENGTPDTRTATLTLTNPSGQIAAPVTITVTQISNVTPTLLIDTNEMEITNVADSYEVNVTANVSWDCVISGEGITGDKETDWLTETERTDSKLTFEVTANTTGVTRYAKLEFRNEEYQLLQTLNVSQLASALQISVDNDNIAYTGGNITISVSSASEWTYETDADWLTEANRADNQLVLTASEFTGYVSRSATVNVNDGYVTRSVTITQAGLVAAAELLDVRFQADGSAVDNSDYHFTINKIPNAQTLTVVANDRFGYAAQFNPTDNTSELDGVGGYYIFDVNEDFRSKVLTDNFAIELYVCSEPRPDASMTVFGKHSTPGYALQFNSHKWNFTINDGGWKNVQTDAFSFDAPRWFHVVAVYEKNSPLKMYIDGELNKEGIVVDQTSPNYDANRLCIGAGYRADDAIQMPFSGTIALVRMYDRILTTDEISGLYEDATSN